MSEIQVNTINEYTGANGVTIDGVLIKDGEVDGVDVSAINQAGLVLINKTTFSASTYATMDNVFTSSYNMYKIKVNLVASVIDEIRIRFRTGGASGSDHSTSALYKYNYNYVPIGSSTGQTHLGASTDNYWQLASAFAGNTGFGMEIYNPYEAKNTLGTWEATGSQSGTDYFYSGAGVLEDTTSLTGFGFYLEDTAKTLTGDVCVYGYSLG